MKAYYVHDGFDAGIIVFALSANKARAAGARKLDCDYIVTRAQRASRFDRYADAGKVPDDVLHAESWPCEPDQTPCEACGRYAYSTIRESQLQESGRCRQCESEGE